MHCCRHAYQCRHRVFVFVGICKLQSMTYIRPHYDQCQWTVAVTKHHMPARCSLFTCTFVRIWVCWLNSCRPCLVLLSHLSASLLCTTIIHVWIYTDAAHEHKAEQTLWANHSLIQREEGVRSKHFPHSVFCVSITLLQTGLLRCHLACLWCLVNLPPTPSANTVSIPVFTYICMSRGT